MRKQAAELGVAMDVPWRELPEQARETVLRAKGACGRLWLFCADGEEEVQAARAGDAEQVSRYAECPDCRGQRLRAEARSVRINGRNICQ